ncbi:MAG: hypothetical protein C0475_03320 [Planctomyces sp.]|nr:hypothetical protein [Planctomyces sp.]MBA4119499.1 hypothetical protein [Isosphaera sp.]
MVAQAGHISHQAQAHDAGHKMRCLEVWGGSSAAAEKLEVPGLDMWVLSRPHNGAAEGGDLHYISSCGTGRISRVVVADVAGHGLEVSSLARGLRDLMRRYMNFVDQSSLVERINRAFAAISPDGRFATALVATYWAPTRSLITTIAGHPRPMAYSSGTGQWQLLAHDPSTPRGANLPLGIDDDSDYTHVGVQLRPGDVVVMYSDALMEAQRAGSSDQLGEPGLLRLIASLDPAKPERLAGDLLTAVESYAGGPLNDDATVVVLTPSARAPVAPLAERLRALGRLCSMTLRGLLVHGQAPPLHDILLGLRTPQSKQAVRGGLSGLGGLNAAPTPPAALPDLPAAR